MRKSAFLLIGALLAAFGCNRELEEPMTVAPQGNTSLRATVSETVTTRTAFADDGTFSWTNGDAFSVYTTKGAFRTFTLSEGAGSADGVFLGDFDAETTSKAAVYPASDNHALSGNALTVHLDDNFTWSADKNSHAPMLAKIAADGDDSFSFKHLGGIIKATFSNVPSSARTFVFTAPGKKVSGDFAIADITAENPVLVTEDSEEGNTVTIRIDNPASEVSFYVPLPTGTYPEFSIELFDALGNPLVLKTRYKDLTIARRDLVLMKAVAGEKPNGKKMLFDFGNTASANTSHATPSPDANGNYWNNILVAKTTTASGNGTSYDLLYTDNAATGYKLTLTSDVRSNGSGNGGLTYAKWSSTTAESLGELAVTEVINGTTVATATEDYFFAQGEATVCSFNLSGLNPGKGYKFHIFGSRTGMNASDQREAKYTIKGSNDFEGLLLISGPGTVQNTDNLLVSDLIYPKPDGTISFSFSKGSNATTSNHYYQLNCMKVEEYEGGLVPTPKYNYSSLDVTSAEETFSMHKAAGDGNIFEGVSTFASGEIAMTAVTTDGKQIPLTTTSTVDGVAYLVADLDNLTYTFTALDAILAQGPAIKGWSNSNGATLDYAGHGVFSGTALEYGGNGAPKYDRSQSFNFVKKGAWNPTFKRITGTRRDIEASTYGTTQDINLNPGVYDVTLNLRDFTYAMERHGGLDENRITVMGSSVPYGQGATSKHGYIWMYEDVLKARTGNSFYISNLSVSGNNTTTLGERFDEETVDGGKNLIVALSLGNEGLADATTSAAMESLYNQWENRVMLNADSFVATARAEGKNVVVTGNYANNNYNADHYSWIRKINLDIQQWDVPSVNLMGAIDDGTGKWMTGYYDDALHPNDAGHQEMAYAMVPSLFDALKAGKAQPTRNTTGSYSLSGRQVIAVAPEGRIHPFTIAFSVKTATAGSILTFFDGETAKTVNVTDAGVLSYGTVTGTTSVKDNAWHLVTLTHFYARGETLLYVDGVLQGSVSEKVGTTAFYVGYAAADVSASWKEVFLWRSGMNADEIAALSDGKMLKSSLEFYAPLAGSLDNLAQSTATLSLADGATLVPAEDTTPRLNGEALDEVGGNLSIGKIELTQNGTLTFERVEGLDDYWIDPDFLYREGGNIKLGAVSGYYQLTLYPGSDKHISVARVNADGSKPNLSQGGLYVAGYGIAGYKMVDEIGWSGSNMYQLAQVSTNVWQVTGIAVPERDPDVQGGKFRYDYISLKYFFQSGWGGEASKGITITGNAADKLTQGGDGNLGLASNLEQGTTYRLTIDFTSAVISGASLSSGAETVSFDKL